MPIIGREPPADIVVPAPQVSAQHARIEHVRDDTYLITDLDSRNGTWVNGQRIQSSFVRPGDVIGLGSHRVDVAAWRHLIPAAGPTIGSPAPAVQEQAPFAPAPPAYPVASVTASPPAPPPMPAPGAARGAPGLGSELAVAMAAQKSFTGKAFFVWFLYWLLWLPGVVMNFVYLSEAKQVEQVTGVAPPGKGCLWVLIITHFWLPLIGIILLFATGGAILSRIF